MGKKLLLVGAKHFLDMQTGTIYQRFWCHNNQELIDIICKFIKCELQIDWNEIEVYGDNGGSMRFDTDEDDNIFYYDANVVGDANPKLTLYLIINENLIPDYLKEDFLKARDIFLTYFDNLDNKTKNENKWAREYLENELKNNSIVNLYLNQGDFICND